MTADAERWDGSCRAEQPPPWDIGRPQPRFATLAETGALRGRLLDCGCGTGEHALMAAAGGADVVGIDLSAYAIEQARRKADARGLAVRFEAGGPPGGAPPGGAVGGCLPSGGLFHLLRTPPPQEGAEPPPPP